MTFLSVSFILFFALVFAGYYLVPDRYRYLVIAAAGCIFYGYGEPSRLLLVFLVTGIVYAGGLVLERLENGGLRRRWYVLFFALTLVPLVIWKVLSWQGTAIPVGLSFYSFQAAGYLHDVYHGKLSAERNPVRLFSFTAFFPTILSGPIAKARYLLPQLREIEKPSSEMLIHGFLLFVFGMAEKVLVADALSSAVAFIFDRYGFYGRGYYLVAAMLFATQLYADFSGYSDMAIGAAAMLGIRLEKNFTNPFLSVSLKDLWNNWHVSLNDWFLENIYFPLGGSRKGTVRKYVNLMIVFLVSGLWHGTGVHFVVWGLFNGALMVVGEVTDPYRKRLRGMMHIREDNPVLVWIRRLLVFLLFSLAFIFFRAGTTKDGVALLLGCLTVRPSDLRAIYLPLLFDNDSAKTLLVGVCILAFFVLQYLRRGKVVKGKNGEKEVVLTSGAYQRFRSLPTLCQVLPVALLLAFSIYTLCAGGTKTNTSFIYFAF
ncbi:MAG: MBOAT family O-acyltransferase [Lachnospiraceae bacterium]|jgi:alginate O-acetyltransferase complex protein AlgI